MAAASARREIIRAWRVTLAAAGVSALTLILGGGVYAAVQTLAFLLLSAGIYQGSRVALVTVMALFVLLALHNLKLYFHGDGLGALAVVLLLGLGAATMAQALRTLRERGSHKPPPAGDFGDAA